MDHPGVACGGSGRADNSRQRRARWPPPRHHQDQEPSARRPHEAQAVRAVYLRPTQLCRAPPPPDSKKQWPLEAQFGCALAGKTRCECDGPRGAALPSNVAPHEHENLIAAGRDAGGAMGQRCRWGRRRRPLRVNRDNGEKRTRRFEAVASVWTGAPKGRTGACASLLSPRGRWVTVCAGSSVRGCSCSAGDGQTERQRVVRKKSQQLVI